MSILLDAKVTNKLRRECYNNVGARPYTDLIDMSVKAQAKKFAEFLLESNNLLTKEGRAVILEIIQQLGGTCL